MIDKHSVFTLLAMLAGDVSMYRPMFERFVL